MKKIINNNKCRENAQNGFWHFINLDIFLEIFPVILPYNQSPTNSDCSLKTCSMCRYLQFCKNSRKKHFIVRRELRIFVILWLTEVPHSALGIEVVEWCGDYCQEYISHTFMVTRKVKIFSKWNQETCNKNTFSFHTHFFVF